MEREDPGRGWSTDLGQRGERGDDAVSHMPDRGSTEGVGVGCYRGPGPWPQGAVGGAFEKSTTSEKVQRQLDRPRRKNTEHKTGSAVKTMLNAKTFRSERRAKHGDKR